MKCPFCEKKLEPIGTSGQFQCGTWGCDASFNFIATRDVWEYIARTRKALDVAVDVAKEIDELLSSNRFDVKEVPLLNITQTKISMLLRYINLEQITAHEQKEIK